LHANFEPISGLQFSKLACNVVGENFWKPEDANSENVKMDNLVTGPFPRFRPCSR
jgi:hypothetical protein